MSCHNCGGTGHFASSCPKPKQCSNCGRRGHKKACVAHALAFHLSKSTHAHLCAACMLRECPQGEGKQNVCNNCGRPGHFVSNCPRPSNSVCYACGEWGHMSRECVAFLKPKVACQEMNTVRCELMAGARNAQGAQRRRDWSRSVAGKQSSFSNRRKLSVGGNTRMHQLSHSWTYNLLLILSERIA